MKSGKAPAIMGGDAQKEAAGVDELLLGDLVQMRKTHPCGSDKWTVIRVGADIKIRCSGCGRIVMMDRADFTKRMKKVIAHATEPIRGTVRVRHTKWENPDCMVTADGENVIVSCDTPVRAPARGQALAIYQGDRVVCGAWIE